MLKLTEELWIGDSTAEQHAKDMGAILNVAHDLVPTRSWNKAYMHVGLVDGPGNEVYAYCSAIFALHALLQKGSVLVCCHTGSRALAISLMYLAFTGEHTIETRFQALQEQMQGTLPIIAKAHLEAFTDVVHLLDTVEFQ